MRTDRQYRIDDLVVIDSPVHGAFNLRAGIWPEETDYSQNTLVLTAFREYILHLWSWVHRGLHGQICYFARPDRRG